ncbi:MAG: C1 family peptidase [Planctomycetota bacterium]
MSYPTTFPVMSLKRHWTWLIVLGGLLAVSPIAAGQLTAEDIDALRDQGVREGWTFTVSENPATQYSLDELCGLVVPERWWEGATFDPCLPTRDLPEAYDWRDYDGVTPIRNQGGCGSCWAFGTVGAMECAIKIRDGVSVDLSEQWLVSCNSNGWSCSGGWWAHNYHVWKGDDCGESGAVPESAFPYVAQDVSCDCPYPHTYWLAAWAFIGAPYTTPDTNSIKYAIANFGPVGVTVYVNSAFQAYSGGVFDGCAEGTINHAVVLVGWDDNDSGGVWILRNSWGPWWGEDGYMRIPYGCSEVGYAACYVRYEGCMEVQDSAGLSAAGQVGGPFDPAGKSYNVRNRTGVPLDYSVTCAHEWLTIENASGTIPALGTAVVPITFNAQAESLPAGDYSDLISFTNETNHDGDTTRAVTLQVGIPELQYQWLLNEDPGWEVNGQWAWGSPTGDGGEYGQPDPAIGHTGWNCLGYNLAGDYTNDMPAYHLTTTPIDCSELYAVKLNFWRYLGVEHPDYDHATISVSNNGGDWVTVWENTDETIDYFWVPREIDISAVADLQPAVQIRWTMGPTDGGWRYCGWNVDDVEIWALSNSPTYQVGDLNCDGAVDAYDIDPFICALSPECDYQSLYPDCDRDLADCNSDGDVNAYDIDTFVQLVGGG